MIVRKFESDTLKPKEIPTRLITLPELKRINRQWEDVIRGSEKSQVRRILGCCIADLETDDGRAKKLNNV